MNAIVYDVYWRLPPSVQSLVASLRGLYLRRWRYGPDTESLVRQALDRESWEPDTWQTWRQRRLMEVLERAATKVPFYRNYWASREREDGLPAWLDLSAWPVLTKETLRSRPRDFVAEDCDVSRMFCEHTSGTTGKPLHLWWSKSTVRGWYGLFEARIRRWHGVSRHDRWAILGGQLVVPVRRSRPPFWVYNAGLNQLYMSSYHLSPSHIADYIEAIRRYRVTYLFGYASSLYSLAQAGLEKGILAPQMKVAISNAEPLYDHQRGAIARLFGCPVRDTYGMAEIAAAASECPMGTMHVWPEVGTIEVLRDDCDEAAAPGETGRLVCTGLLNTDMPLVRYQLGDRGALRPGDTRCACGRALPILLRLDGRNDDVLVTPDGRRVGRLDPVFKADLCIREAQIIQKARDTVHVRVVPGTGYSERDESSIIQRLRERVGNMAIKVEIVDQIPRTANGKFRAVINEAYVSDPRSSTL